MKRLTMEILMDGTETLEQLAECCELSLDEFISFNPYIRRYLYSGYRVTVRLVRDIQRGIHVSSYKSDDEIM